MTTPHARTVTDPKLGDAAVFGGASALLAVFAVVVLNEFVSDGGALAGFAVAAGLLVCVWLALRSANPYRGLGLYVWLGLGAVGTTGLWAFGGIVPPGPWLAVLAGSVIGVFAAAYYARAARRAGAALWNPMRPVPPVATAVVGIVLAACAAIGLGLLVVARERISVGQLRMPGFAFAFAFATGAVVRLFRPAFEWFLSFGYSVMYRGGAFGPGAVGCPPVGPVLVVANHAAVFDPIAVQKMLLRPVTGMMSSLYYDRPLLRILARDVFRTIRVPHGIVRHEAPELREAVAALDRGECVLIFPEAWLRRKDDVPLKRFARGVWQILRDRPDTPVVACWVEGMWGSYFSHKGGSLGKGKRFDVRRRVDLGFSAATPVPPEVLADQWATRFYLMNAVSDARRHLGLEPLPKFERETTDAEE